MLDRKRPHRLTDDRNALGGEGEQWVGARARRRWWGRAALAATGVLLAVGAASVYLFLRPASDGPGFGANPKVKVKCANASCGHTATIGEKPGQTYPLICPKCGQHTLSQVWRCTKCRREFVPVPTGMPIACPNCGSTSVGAASASGP
jgi:DNA-directed RNA polymerase subunit RPC12/RpoP